MAFPRQRLVGHVEQVFDRAVNLFVPEQKMLYALLSDGYDNAPNSCRIALKHCEKVFSPGEPVQFLTDGIEIGQNKWIDLSRCHLWQCSEKYLFEESITHINWFKWSQWINQHALSGNSLFDYLGDNIFYQEMARLLQSNRCALLKAISRNENIDKEINALIGLGIGLTPSGDDYLVGLCSILMLSGNPLRKYREIFLTALNKAKEKTTLLSAITLEEAINQRYRQVIGELIEKIVQDDSDLIIHTINEIKKVGSSSGCDMLFGMADACLLTAYFGEHNANQDHC
ncbi:DUF2877 domain-containing protein [Serratia sp. UGAL515B_01]|uniref:DUF2877 domain-containing protein n=1 Tax=Serratia sp. UGAL515B_01 TaxID=2986763 RepID=UPI0029555770|nr:DUF2877 domain-containing protein [Serratia sp. UGAL515B_01]WON76247.1 DUF2877 domain-containing protein [Serratia sp. UGAL515B_01]